MFTQFTRRIKEVMLQFPHKVQYDEDDYVPESNCKIIHWEK